MRSELTQKLQGTPQSYWILRIINPDRTIRAVHTSKKLSYLQKILARYKNQFSFSI